MGGGLLFKPYLVNPPQNFLAMNNAKYKRIKKNLYSITDKLGMHIDSGIIDAVTVFKMLGFTTTQSCEGHLDHGYISPWIQFGTKLTPTTKKLKAKIELLNNKIAKIRKKTTQSLNEVTPLFNQLSQTENNLAKYLRKDLLRLYDYLNEYYLSRTVPFDQRLIIFNLTTHFQLIFQGAQMQDIFTKKRKQTKLKLYKQEFTEFTNFLKIRYL